jgi:hypothetical protein
MYYNHPDTMGSYTHELQAHSIKISSPWILECNDDVDWLFVNPIWNTASMEFTVLPGTLRFKYPLQSNINIMVRKGLSSNIMIGAGTPIAHLIPLSERNINLKCHLISDTEMIERKLDVDPFFFGSYKKVVELKEKQQKKCPFHH